MDRYVFLMEGEVAESLIFSSLENIENKENEIFPIENNLEILLFKLVRKVDFSVPKSFFKSSIM
jgi:hypothetical protein